MGPWCFPGTSDDVADVDPLSCGVTVAMGPDDEAADAPMLAPPPPVFLRIFTARMMPCSVPTRNLVGPVCRDSNVLPAARCVCECTGFTG